MTVATRTPSASRETRVHFFAVLALLLVLTLSWLPRLQGPIDLRWDAAAYYSLGTALARGEGYRYSSEPVEVKAVNYPPLLPLVIAAHQHLLHTSDPVVVGRWLKFTFVGVWMAFLAAAYLLLRRDLPFGFALAGTSVCGLHARALWVSNVAYADLPFALFLLLFVIAQASARRWLAVAGGWLFATLAFLARTAGVALFAAWVAEALLRRRYRLAGVRLALALVPFLAWQGWVTHVESQASYRHPGYEYARADYVFYNVSYARNNMLRDPQAPELGRATPLDLAKRFIGNVAAAPLSIGGATLESENDLAAAMTRLKTLAVAGRLVPWASIPVVLVTLGLAAILGLVLLGARGNLSAVCTVAAYVALLSMLNTRWHWPRFLVAISPLLVLALIFALKALGQKFARSVLAVVLAFQAAFLVAYFRLNLETVIHDDWAGHRVVYRLFSYDRSFAALDGALVWVQRHAQPHDVVVSSMAPWVNVRTGNPAVLPPLVQSADEAQFLLDSVPAHYVVIDTCGFSFTRKYALPVMTRWPSRWRLVYGDPATAAVYARVPAMDALR